MNVADLFAKILGTGVRDELVAFLNDAKTRNPDLAPAADQLLGALNGTVDVEVFKGEATDILQFKFKGKFHASNMV